MDGINVSNPNILVGSSSLFKKMQARLHGQVFQALQMSHKLNAWQNLGQVKDLFKILALLSCSEVNSGKTEGWFRQPQWLLGVHPDFWVSHGIALHWALCWCLHPSPDGASCAISTTSSGRFRNWPVPMTWLILSATVASLGTQSQLNLRGFCLWLSAWLKHDA